MIWESILLGFVLGNGLALLWWALVKAHPTLAERVRQGSVRDARALRNPLLVAVEKYWTAVIESIGSTAQSVERRLELLGSVKTLTSFRIEQLIASVLSMMLVGTLSIGLLKSWSVGSLLVSLVALLVGALSGVALWDQLLTMRASRRQALIDRQVPDTSDLLALAIGAGESVPSALERMSRVSHGDLSAELARTVTQLHSGVPTIMALSDLSQRNESRALDRLCQTLITAIERGSPLAAVLHDQAQDIRESSRQKLMEEGGKREILMLVPVVFFILPITILFALYPGLASLNVSP